LLHVKFKPWRLVRPKRLWRRNLILHDMMKQLFPQGEALFSNARQDGGSTQGLFLTALQADKSSPQKALGDILPHRR
jgi:hypothetical protein